MAAAQLRYDQAHGVTAAARQGASLKIRPVANLFNDSLNAANEPGIDCLDVIDHPGYGGMRDPRAAGNFFYIQNLPSRLQRNCLEESWQCLTLQKLRYKLFLLPGELTRPQNRPVFRLRESPLLQDLANGILRKAHRLKPLQV